MVEEESSESYDVDAVPVWICDVFVGIVEE